MSGPRVVVGCPISHRGWIIGDWITHLINAMAQSGIGDEGWDVVFVGDTTKDEPMWKIIGDELVSDIIHVPDSRGTDKRVWKWERYVHMAELRNTLLARVRELEPTFFLSLDSDILLHDQALATSAPLVVNHVYDAVALGCYMTPKGTHCPNHGLFTREGQIRRSDWRGHGQVDVIMAAKLMNRRAYTLVDYAPSTLGEDIGWSKNAAFAGLKLGWDGRVMSKHCLNEAMLHTRDPRVDL